MIEKDVLAALLEYKNWARYGKEFSPEFFNVESYSKIYSLICRYFNVLEEPVEKISRETLNKLADYNVKSQQEREKLFKIIESLYAINAVEIEPLVREALVRWRAQQLLISAEEALQENELDPSLVSRDFAHLAKSVEKEETPEVPPNEDVESLLTRAKNQRVYPTGLDSVDSALDGGAWEGQVNVVLGILFGGKSLALTSFGGHNLRLGNPVIGFTCENSRQNWVIRFFQNLLKLERDMVLYRAKETAAQIEKMQLPPWSIKDCRSSGITIPFIKRSLDKFLPKCEIPPLVLIDQLVLGGVRPTDRRITEPRFQLSAATEELLEIAADYSVAIWAPTQANRAGFTAEVIRSVDVAECLDIPRKVDTVLSLNQNQMEKASGSMRVWVDKARERKLSTQLHAVRVVPEFQTLEEFI